MQRIFLTDLSKRLKLGASRSAEIFGVRKAKAQKKGSAGALVTGLRAHKALGTVKLLAIAQNMVQNSTAPGAVNFDVAAWLGQWVDLPQPALEGRRPSELLDTPTGRSLIARLLGSIESGAYQ